MITRIESGLFRGMDYVLNKKQTSHMFLNAAGALTAIIARGPEPYDALKLLGAKVVFLDLPEAAYKLMKNQKLTTETAVSNVFAILADALRGILKLFCKS